MFCSTLLNQADKNCTDGTTMQLPGLFKECKTRGFRYHNFQSSFSKQFEGTPVQELQSFI